MNNTFVIALASLGGLLWLFATFRERYKNTPGGTVWKFVRNLFSSRETVKTPEIETPVPEPTGDTTTIEALERELGIEPDHYLCDRIARINEALVARRDKPVTKKKGGAQ